MHIDCEEDHFPPLPKSFEVSLGSVGRFLIVETH